MRPKSERESPEMKPSIAKQISYSTQQVAMLQRARQLNSQFELARRRREGLKELVDELGGVGCRRGLSSYLRGRWCIVIPKPISSGVLVERVQRVATASPHHHPAWPSAPFRLQLMRDDGTDAPCIIVILPNSTTTTTIETPPLPPLPIRHSSGLLHQLPQQPNLALNRIVLGDRALQGVETWIASED